MSDLATVIAKQAIQELVVRYCRAVDRRDFDILHTLYHKDGIDEHGAMYSGSASGYIAWLPTVLAGMQCTSHSVTNHLIHVQGHQAEGEVYCTAYHLTAASAEHPATEIIIGGRYLDKYVFDDGRWQFMHRKIVMDWNQIKPSSCDMNSPIVAGSPVGSAIASDPSRTFFDFFRG